METGLGPPSPKRSHCMVAFSLFLMRMLLNGFARLRCGCAICRNCWITCFDSSANNHVRSREASQQAAANQANSRGHNSQLVELESPAPFSPGLLNIPGRLSEPIEGEQHLSECCPSRGFVYDLVAGSVSLAHSTLQVPGSCGRAPHVGTRTTGYALSV